MSDQDNFTTVNKKVHNIKQTEDDQEDDSVNDMKNQINAETNMENLLMDIRNYTENQCVEIGNKLTIHHLLDFFYPNIKSVF